MGTKTQWVNYPSTDGRVGAFNLRRSRMTDRDVTSVDDMGRDVFLRVRFQHRDRFCMAKLTLKRHPQNAAYTATERSRNAGIFAPTREDYGIISRSGEALFQVRLTPAGGDRYKFEAENLFTGTKVQGRDEIQTRRKLFCQVVR
ncbi:MAG: hypothetical protein PVF68_04975, partial [Acidobacteriota bacterium]